MKEIENILEKCREEEFPACKATCPLHVDMRGAVALVREGKFDEAVRLIKDKLPFPGIMGRICTHPCEDKCMRKEIDEPIAIAALKRAASDYAETVQENGTIAEEINKKVAVVGGGPAGLMAAHDLRRMGYRVTIFEALPILGGMLAVGIPEFRLPRDILQTELNFIQKLGIEVKLNTKIGAEVKFSDLIRDFDAIFLGTGAHRRRNLGIENEKCEGVVDGLEFLGGVNLGKRVNLKDRVVILGGGNVAIDCARTCLRSGITDVKILYRRSQEEMPAIRGEVEEAEREGVKINLLAAPVKVLAEKDKVTGIRCIRMQLVEPDDSGRRRPVPIEGSEFVIETDMIIKAIGEQPDLSFLGQEGETLYIKEGLLQVNALTSETGIRGVFAGGDVVTGPVNVINALSAGRKAAISIDRYIKGADLIVGRDGEGSQETRLMVKTEGIPHKKRISMSSLSIDERKGGFKEVELGLSKVEAKEEADRCLQCECKLCVKDCEFLKSYGESPKALAGKFKNGYFREEPIIPYSCNSCSLCEVVCPEDLNIGEMCLEIRRQLVREKLGPLPKHRIVIDNQTWVSSESFFLSLPGSNVSECKRFFFPGCGLSAYSPDLVIKTYEYLQNKLPGTGIILGCCGAPSNEIGDLSRFQDMIGKITSEMERAGAVELIVACPDCYHTFKGNASHVPLKSLYEVISECGLPREARRTGRTLSIHDSCKTRYESKVQDSVRKIAKELGFQIDEVEYARDKTRCCGMGGMIAFVDLKLLNRITRRRVDELPNDVLTYCASCRDAFAIARKPTLHILDIIFNPEWEKAVKNPAVIGAARQKNQSRLREQLLNSARNP